jgi:hypothetical protein
MNNSALEWWNLVLGIGRRFELNHARQGVSESVDDQQSLIEEAVSENDHVWRLMKMSNYAPLLRCRLVVQRRKRQTR